MRARPLLPTLAIVALTFFGTPGSARAVDGSPPVGTLEIEGGVGYTRDRTLTLDVAAEDDVGVETVLVGLLGGAMTEYAYAPRIEWAIPDNVSEQTLSISVSWRDAAGNISTAHDSVLFDATPPSFSSFKETTSSPGPPGTISFYVGGDDPTSGVRAVRFSTDGGAHWGTEIAMTDQIVFWDPRDAAVGGKPNGLGPVAVKARIRDGAFNWSSVRTTTVQYTTSVQIRVSAHPTTGQPITFTPRWSEPVTIPADSQCMWEFMTGDDQSIFSGDHDDTFSYNMTEGKVSGGGCGPWTFTLPWSTVRQYLVAYRVILPDGSEIDSQLGSPGDVAFTSVVGSTSRAIHSSNLPMFYVLPDDNQPTVGVPTTYRGFAIGGATIKASDKWSVVENGLHFYPGASSFTFTPQKAGHVTVCLSRGSGSAPLDQLGACFDPQVRKAAGGGATTPPEAGTPASSAAPGSSVDPPTDPAPTGATTASGGPTTKPGEVALGVAGPDATDGPLAGPNLGATAGSSDPGPVWAAILLAAVLLAGGAAMLMRPDIRTRLRSRISR